MVRRPKILLVDDQPDVRFLISVFLEDEGVHFDEADSAEAALAAARATAYDAILLDHRMPPGPGGLEIAERLRAERRDVPIVLYSASLDPHAEDRARELGLRTVGKGEPDRLMEVLRHVLASSP